MVGRYAALVLRQWGQEEAFEQWDMKREVVLWRAGGRPCLSRFSGEQPPKRMCLEESSVWGLNTPLPESPVSTGHMKAAFQMWGLELWFRFLESSHFWLLLL